jgi:hypothetical protein
MVDNTTIKAITTEVERVFKDLTTSKIPFFEVLKEEYIPDGLKAHTRSICWLAEQVLLQNLNKHRDEYNISKVEYPVSDYSPWDGKFKINSIGQEFVHVNIKVTDNTKPIRENDIASVKKLLKFYSENPESLLFYAVVRFRFDKNAIRFEGEPIVRYYPWLEKFKVNVRNEHLQAFYSTPVVERSIADFCTLLKEKAVGKGLLRIA